MKLYLMGFEMGVRAWHSDDRTSGTMADHAEVTGGSYLEGFNEALSFLSTLAANALT